MLRYKKTNQKFMNSKKIKIYTLGCKVNRYDSDFLLSKLEFLGFEKVNENADLAIINSCAVTKTAIRKDRQIINKAKRENPQAKIILMGCWPEVYRDEIKLKNIDLIWGVGEPNKLIEKIQEKFIEDNFVRAESSKALELSALTKLSSTNLVSTDRVRYFLKIQDGCEQFCSYCIIPYTRGKLKSRNKKDIIKEIKEAVQHGFKEIVLTGIHLGLYGREKGNKDDINLSTLVKEIIKIQSAPRLKNLKRLRLSSIEVTEVSDELIYLIKKHKNFCPYLHISLQSGNDKILKLMNRPYSAEYFYEKVKKIRKEIPDIAISTDIIVGFPGESEEDFQETLKFVQKIKFSKIHVFPFSGHEKTKAFKMPNQIKREEILNRSRILRKLSLEQENSFKKKFNNKELEILIEHIKSDGIIMGRSEYYFDVLFREGDIVKKESDGNLINRIVDIEYKF
jgi:threonylcarbamoyladenosine tRNA methylthiotransferase MtaB